MIAYVTPSGLAKIAASVAAGTPVGFSMIEIGNGNVNHSTTGYTTYDATSSQAALRNKTAEFPLLGYRLLPDQKTLLVQAMKPSTVGGPGQFVTEFAMKSSTGEIMVIGTTPATEIAANTGLGELGNIWEVVIRFSSAQDPTLYTGAPFLVTYDDLIRVLEGGNIKKLIRGTYEKTWTGTEPSTITIPISPAVNPNQSVLQLFSLAFVDDHGGYAIRIEVAADLNSTGTGIEVTRVDWPTTWTLHFKAKYTIVEYGVNIINQPT